MRHVIAILSLLIASIVPGGAARAGSAVETSPSLTLVADLSRPIGKITLCGSGFLHSMNATSPTEELVAPLRPRAFRGRADERYLLQPGFYDRLVRLGVRHIQVVVSDSWGYPNGFFGWPGDNNNWKPWEDAVDRVVAECARRKQNVEFDIWNEPDGKYFWAPDRGRWLETWKRGYSRIRSQQPKAAIAGPSISNYSLAFLEEFLVYAKANQCVPDILSWHELGAPTGGRIPEHTRKVKDLVTSLGLSISRFSINEIIPANRQYSPATAISYFAALETAGIESACHSCWGDEAGSNCDMMMLDGLLTPDSKAARAAWWAYASYGEMGGAERIEVREVGSKLKPRIDALAALNTERHSVSLLIANCETTRSVALRFQARNLEVLGVGNRLQCEVKLIPAGGPRPVSAVACIASQTVRKLDEFEFENLPSIPPESVYEITIARWLGAPVNLR
jgi:hypothetical protein